MLKPKEKTLKAKLDTIFSEYIRRSYADSDGYVTCYCGATVPWKEADNSHYIPRGCLHLRYDERNCHPSCRRCNRFRGGNLADYSIFLEDKYGQGILQTLSQEKHKIVKNFPFQKMIDTYKAKLASL